MTAFVHGAQYQWHNDDTNKDGATVLSRLRPAHVRAKGYANLRCAWVLGCPAELHPRRPSWTHPTERNYAAAFRVLFAEHGGNATAGDGAAGGDGEKGGELQPPEAVGVSCCAQFAVSREMVRRRPKRAYEHWRRWLLETPLDDEVSGRILEYSWHSKSLSSLRWSSVRCAGLRIG